MISKAQIFSKIIPILCVGYGLLLPVFASAQNEDHVLLEELYAELEVLFEKEDDITRLLVMVDSLLVMENHKPHALLVRAGYISRILSAGRDFGVNQFGALTGVTYMHPSGFYMDMRQYLNSGQSPAYYMTDISAGYLWQPNAHWDINLSHDFFFFNKTIDPVRFRGSGQVSTFRHGKHHDIGIEYAYLHGNENAHRLFLFGNGRFTFRTRGFIQKVVLFPGIMAQWGSANVYFLRQPEPPGRAFFEVVQSGQYPGLQRSDYLSIAAMLNRGNQTAIQNFLRRRSFSPQMVQDIFEQMEDRQIGVEEVFGLMNFGAMVPVAFYHGAWGLLANYTINFPVALPGESYRYPVNSFFSLGLSYAFLWGKKSKGVQTPPASGAYRRELGL